MRRRRARVGVLAGTFDHLHAGHRRLLDAAFRYADRVGIGVTTERYLRAHAKAAAGRLQPYRIRRARLARYLRTEYPPRRWWLVPLEDGVGGALAPDVELLVASEDTRRGATKVNALRAGRGLRPVRLRLVPMLLADDLLPLSSTRIRLGVVDADGRRRRPVTFARRGDLTASQIRGLERGVRAGLPPGVASRWVDRPARRRNAGPRSAAREAAELRAAADYGVALRGDRRPKVVLADAHGQVDGRGPPRVTISGQVVRAFRSRRRRWVGAATSTRRA